MTNFVRRAAIRYCISVLLLAVSAMAGEQAGDFGNGISGPQREWSLAATEKPKLPRLFPDQQFQAGTNADTRLIPSKPGFNWSGALKQSGLLLGIQHSLRMLQEKTRNRLDGKWWDDYMTSVEGLQGWNDGNPIITNYVGHPIMGAVTGYIQIQNDPLGARLEWAPHDSNYWKSRMKAMGWTALYSTQYELGPLGEAMIGNVGFNRGTMGYVDLVVTPAGGLGMILLEDWLDKRVVEKLERGKGERQARFLRVVLNPQRSIANLLRFKRPSHRDTRELAP
jgi:hypothetical protein